MFKTSTIKPTLIDVTAKNTSGVLSQENLSKVSPAAVTKLASVSNTPITDDKSLAEAKATQATALLAAKTQTPVDDSYFWRPGSPEFDNWVNGRIYNVDGTYLGGNSYNSHVLPADVAAWEASQGLGFVKQTDEEWAQEYANKINAAKGDAAKEAVIKKMQEDCLKRNGLSIKYPDDLKVNPSVTTILASCEILKKSREASNKLKLDELAKNTDGLADACGFSNYDVTGSLASLVNSAMGMNLFDTAFSFPGDGLLAKAMKCFKSVLNTGLTVAKIGTSAIGFAAQGSAGMLESAMTFSGVDSVVKPLLSVKNTAANLDISNPSAYADMGNLLSTSGMSNNSIITTNSYGLPSGYIKDGNLIDSLNGKGISPLLDGGTDMNLNDFDMIGAAKKAVA